MATHLDISSRIRLVQPLLPTVIVVDQGSDEGVSLTKAKYQQLIGLLNSQCHFATQAPLETVVETPQVVNIIAQSSIGLQGHELSSIWSSPSLEYSMFSSTIDISQLDPTDWILDSGATDHMVHFISFFKTITSIVQISVRLPNGDLARVTHIGTVQVSASLILENVLCIPSFSFNLVSISKLTQNPSCCCIFLSHYCFIQDLQLWRMIGLGKKQGGLYILQTSTQIALPKSVSDVLSKLSSHVFVNNVHSCTFVSSNDDFRLWHCRLGHPSSQRLALMKSIVPVILAMIIKLLNAMCVLWLNKRDFPFLIP